jgi:uncharacterized repeat protein (TIGR04076 family)
MRDVKVTVGRVRGHYPVYSVGDQFAILQGYKLWAERTLCVHSLASILPWYVALANGVPPKKLGLGNEELAYVQCPDPSEYTGGGTVVFEIRRVNGE